MSKDKLILDACCGGRRFWFDKSQADTLYVDNRPTSPEMVGMGKNARIHECNPDMVMDFRDLELPDSQFSLVVFDPPHFTSLGEKSYMAKKYGKLAPSWREDLQKGFAECFRVLKPEGVLIFKWNEYDIELSEVLKLSPYHPLFGHPSGKTQLTHWVTFMKLPSTLKHRGGLSFPEALLSGVSPRSATSPAAKSNLTSGGKDE